MIEAIWIYNIINVHFNSWNLLFENQHCQFDALEKYIIHEVYWNLWYICLNHHYVSISDNLFCKVSLLLEKVFLERNFDYSILTCQNKYWSTVNMLPWRHLDMNHFYLGHSLISICFIKECRISWHSFS